MLTVSFSHFVKGFGCRPAGVRKPPREETAMREAWRVPLALWGFERGGGAGGAATRSSAPVGEVGEHERLDSAVPTGVE